MLKKLRTSAKNSIFGLRAAFKADYSFKLECLVIIFFAVTLLFLNISYGRKLAMIASLLLVICVELINTAIEKLADRLVPEYDIQIKFVKDVASAAVLVAITIAILVFAFCIFA
jgi:diacylglycerol kinase (ATP)